MRNIYSWMTIVASGAALGWLCGKTGTTTPVPKVDSPELAPPSLLGDRHNGWLRQWQEDETEGSTSSFKIPRVTASENWDEDRLRLAKMADQDPAAAIRWIRDHLPEDEQENKILSAVINPMMAADFHKAIDLLASLDLETREASSGRSFFWLFQYVPGGRLPDLGDALLALDANEVLYRRGLPDLVKEWARLDLEAAAAWVEATELDAEPIHADLTAIVGAARIQEGSIPHDAGNFLTNASERVLGLTLRDLYQSALRLPGDPGEHAQKLLAVTPAVDQERYASSFVASWAQADPFAASNWALSFEDLALAKNLLTSSVGQLFLYEPEQAAIWKSEQTPEERILIDSALAEARSKGGPPP